MPFEGLDFDSLTSSLTTQYIAAVVMTILAVAVTFVLYWINKGNNICPEEGQDLSEAGPSAFGKAETSSDRVHETDGSSTSTPDGGSDSTIDKDSSKQNISFKQSSAKAAEMVIAASMTEEQKEKEKEVQRQQLAQIFKLMQEQSEKFGMTSMEEVEQQMQLYQR